MNWVIQAWEDVPHDLLQRGMESLILAPALAPLPPPLTHMTSDPHPEPADVERSDAALGALEGMGAHDVPLNPDAPDSDESISSSDDDQSEEDEAPPAPGVAPPREEPWCMRCERPVRPKNSTQCVKCAALYHVGCLDSLRGRCMACA